MSTTQQPPKSPRLLPPLNKKKGKKSRKRPRPSPTNLERTAVNVPVEATADESASAATNTNNNAINTTRNCTNQSTPSQRENTGKKSGTPSSRKTDSSSTPQAKILRNTDKFVEAAGNGHIREVAWRILNGQEVNARHAYLELTALMIASSSGHDEVVMLLLEEGASVDLTHRITGYTSLHYASSSGRHGVVKTLLSAGANKSIRTKDKRMTPLMLAEEFKKDDVRALLRDPPYQMDTPLTTNFDKASFGIMYRPPISKGADLDGYRLLVKTHPGGFADPTPDDYQHKLSLPDEKAGWGAVYSLDAKLVNVFKKEETKLIKALARAAAAAALVVDDGEEEGEGKGKGKGEREREREREEEPATPTAKWEEEEESDDELDIYGEPIQVKRGKFSVLDLAPATTYTYAIRAHNAAGWGPISLSVSLRTLPDVPGIPTNLVPTGNTATAVSLEFKAPIDYGEPIDWYEVAFRYYEPPEDDEIALAVLKETDVAYRAPVGEWIINKKKITDSSQYCHVTNLPPASWHDFRIRAHNAVGYSDWSK
jgi:hypothetical protein